MSLSSLATSQAKKPNVVVVLTDDQRADTLSCEGHACLKTPNLDRLAREGTRFKNSFVTTSLCSPSRASLLSGLYAHSHKVVDNFTEYPKELQSYPRRLHEAGYETAYIGKWHMGENSDDKRPGFDFFATHKGQGKYFDTEFNVNGKREVLKGYYTVRVTDLAVDWLKEKHDKPFLLILGHKAPHGPFEPEEKYKTAFDNVKIEYPASSKELSDKPDWFKQRLPTWHGIHGPLYGFRTKFPDDSPAAVKDFAAFYRSYHSVISSVDDSVGRLYAELERQKILDDTIFVFTSDNGFLLGEHGMIDKRTMHEESIRVPLLVRYPRAISKPVVVDSMVLNVDFAPSILDLCGAKAIDKTHGKSWKQLLTGDTKGWRSSFFYEYNYEQEFPYTPNVRGVRTAEWKYIRYPHGDGKADRHRAELYNLKSDPQELKNLIADPNHADKVTELQAELTKLMRESDALPDKMPLDEGIKNKLPDQKIR